MNKYDKQAVIVAAFIAIGGILVLALGALL